MAKIVLKYVHNPWPRVDKTIRRAVKVTLAGCHFRDKAEISILLSSDEEVRHLNDTYRGIDKATNVLSFSMVDDDPHWGKKKKRLLGDIVLAYETLLKEATTRHIPLKHHLSHLVIHGVLHLLGYDHEISSEEAHRQESLETKLLADLGIADPYG